MVDRTKLEEALERLTPSNDAYETRNWFYRDDIESLAEAARVLLEFPTEAMVRSLAVIMHRMACLKDCTRDPSVWDHDALIALDAARDEIFGGEG